MSEKTNKTRYLILSVLIAIAFWVYVDTVEGNTITNTFYNVQVEYIGESDTLPSRGLMLAQGETVEMDIELRGLRSVISGLSSADLRIQVDLSNITAVGTYPLSYDLLLPDTVGRADVTIEKASRSTITVRVVELYKKSIPVNVSFTGDVAENYHYEDSEKIYRQEITISGLEEEVDRISEAYIEIDLNGTNASISGMYTYVFRDEQGNTISDPGSVRVSDKRIPVSLPVYEIKTIPLVVRFSEAPGSELVNVEHNLSVDTIQVAVQTTGDSSDTADMTELVLGVVDLREYLSDTEIVYDIVVPEGCKILSGETKATLTLRFSGLKTVSFTIPVSAVEVRGLADGLIFNPLSGSDYVQVIVRGPADDMEKLTAEDIHLAVDLSKYSSDRTHTIPLTVKVEGYAHVGAVGLTRYITGTISEAK